MATSNGHASLTKQDSKSAAVVQVNSLSEDDQLVNPADHDGEQRFLVTLLDLLLLRCDIGILDPRGQCEHDLFP